MWSLTTKTDIELVVKLQKKCIRIINFSLFKDHTNGLFIENKLLKLQDVIKLNQLLIIYQFHSGRLPNDLDTLSLWIVYILKKFMIIQCVHHATPNCTFPKLKQPNMV